MTHTIEKAHVFSTGEHNGLKFTESDLDEIVKAFNATESSGRIPVKRGHRGADAREDDTQPALGWITKVWREGSRLYARIDSIPDELAASIREGRFKFVSIELLKNVKDSAGRAWRWLLDAVAVLGASKPAVANLEPLSMRRLAIAGERFSFTLEAKQPMTDELRILTDKVIALTFSQAISAGRVRPADRELFTRRYPDATVAEAEAFIAATPAPRELPGAVVGTPAPSGPPDAVLFELARAEQKRARIEDHETLDLVAAAKVVMSRDKSLARAWQFANDPR